MGVTLDPRDECRSEAIDGERPGDLQRLAGRDVRRDLVVRHAGEAHGCLGDGCSARLGGRVDHTVTGHEHP